LVVPLLATLQSFALVEIPALLLSSFGAMTLGVISTLWSELEDSSKEYLTLAWNGLAFWMVLSLAAHMMRNGLSLVFLWDFDVATHGYSDPKFSISNTHLWLSAWLIFTKVARLAASTRDSRRIYFFLFCLIWLIVTVAAVWTQRNTAFPAPFAESVLLVAFAPFEDIHAYGSVLASMMIVSCAMIRSGWSGVGFAMGGCIALLLLATSYSRGGWLGALYGTTLLAAIRLSRRIVVILLLIGCTSLVLIFFLAPKLQESSSDPRIRRLVSFIRVDRWTETESSRLNLYGSGMRMMADRPWFGHGTGSSRRISAEFASEEDSSQHNTSDFIHNFVLQVAAESGIPAALLLLSVLGIVLGRAWGAIRRRCASRETQALFVGCITYLVTQLTANAINIYPTQVFFFWPLLAMLWVFVKEDLANSGKH
jgi:O-antigen ligase